MEVQVAPWPRHHREEIGSGRYLEVGPAFGEVVGKERTVKERPGGGVKSPNGVERQLIVIVRSSKSRSSMMLR